MVDAASAVWVEGGRIAGELAEGGVEGPEDVDVGWVRWVSELLDDGPRCGRL